MKKTLEKIGLLKRSTYILDMQSSEFLDYLKGFVGIKKEIKLFVTPDFKYFGQVDLLSFEITENDKTFGNTSDAKVTGKVIEVEDKIEIQIESILLGAREYIFALAGITMFIVGIFKIIVGDLTVDNLSVATIGLFLLVFTYAYMRRDSKLAIIHFNQTIQKIVIKSKP